MSSTSQGHTLVPNIPKCKMQHRNSSREEASTHFAKNQEMAHHAFRLTSPMISLISNPTHTLHCCHMRGSSSNTITCLQREQFCYCLTPAHDSVTTAGAGRCSNDTGHSNEAAKRLALAGTSEQLLRTSPTTSNRKAFTDINESCSR